MGKVPYDCLTAEEGNKLQRHRQHKVLKSDKKECSGKVTAKARGCIQKICQCARPIRSTTITANHTALCMQWRSVSAAL
jgi:hypothetical protein